MKLSHLLINVLLVSLVVVSLYALEFDLASDRILNVAVNTSYSTTYNKVTEIMNHTNTTYTSITSLSPEKQRSFFTGTWDILKISISLVMDSITLPYYMIIDFATDIGLSSTITNILLTILIILSISALIFLITKREW